MVRYGGLARECWNRMKSSVVTKTLSLKRKYSSKREMATAGCLFLGSTTLVAVSLQAWMAFQSYRTNPRGKLVIPPGATQGEEEVLLDAAKGNMVVSTAILSPQQKPPVTYKNMRTPKIIVIGDSLACGVGSVNRWDNHQQNYKNNSAEEGEDGPVLPRIFAHSLAQRWQCKVQWRCAGVVGGCVEDIRRECMDVIRQEVRSGNPPDVVVVLCGMNDMKLLMTHPWTRAMSAYSFRKHLLQFCEEIRQEAPMAQVVLPALPISCIYESTNSILHNTYPLTIFLDYWIRFWDLQKHYVANQLSEHVTFIDRPQQQLDGDRKGGLISPLTAEDGIHPSNHGYSVWAKYLGHSLVDKVQHMKHLSKERMEHVRDKSRETVIHMKQRYQKKLDDTCNKRASNESKVAPSND